MAANVVVVGAGQMGTGIAQVAAQAGYSVTLCDLHQEALEKARVRIEQCWQKMSLQGKITPEQAEQYGNGLKLASDLENVSAAYMVIEAVNEELNLKLQILQKLSQLCSLETIVASNTSSLSITLLAKSYKNSCNFIGLHFMNPVPVMELVEVIRAEQTGDEAYTQAVQFIHTLGKKPVTVQDYPGFVLNRLLFMMINEAIYSLMEGAAGAEEIDQVMKLGARHPMGPLELADLIGLDTCLAILETLHAGFADPKYRPCPLLRRMVNAGYLGQKSGRGFYKY